MKHYYLIDEIQYLKFYELPNVLYNAILHDLTELFGVMTVKMLDILNNAPICEIDQYVNIYKYIHVI